MVDVTEVSLLVYKTTFKLHVNTAYPCSRIRLLPHSSLGLSKASFSNTSYPTADVLLIPFSEKEDNIKATTPQEHNLIPLRAYFKPPI